MLALSGVPMANITSLAVLVEVNNAKTILSACRGRVGDGSSQLHSMALLLKLIAENWAKAPAPHVEKLGRFSRNVARPSLRMTPKNRERLRQFENPANVHRLLNLPRKVFREVERAAPGDRSSALRVMRAIAVELLIVVPLRFGNLVTLDIGERIRVAPGATTIMHIVIPAEEMKGREPHASPHFG